jgi:uncharacterized SAM-binding protein YcdF (DUF218 family)
MIKEDSLTRYRICFLPSSSLNMYFLCSRFWFLRVRFAQFAFKVINLFLCTSMNYTVRVYVY